MYLLTFLWLENLITLYSGQKCKKRTIHTINLTVQLFKRGERREIGLSLLVVMGSNLVVTIV